MLVQEKAGLSGELTTSPDVRADHKLPRGMEWSLVRSLAGLPGCV